MRKAITLPDFSFPANFSHLRSIFSDGLRKKYFILGLDIWVNPWCHEATQELQGEAQAPTKGSEAMEEMTQAELTVLLETLAKLVEATAKDAEDAARIIREAIPAK